MNNQVFFSSLSEEVKKKLPQCKTQDEIRRMLTEAGVEPLDDELLDVVSGGMRDPVFCDICERH